MVKKEMQSTIIQNNNKKKNKEEFMAFLKLISPGTHLRTGIENIVKAGKGAIIIVGNEDISQIMDGGFRINAKFTAQRLLELAKMDGAIILSKDMKKILYANVHLTPNSKIFSNETGTRHKAAERTAKMMGTLSIAISERKNEITIYYKTIRYSLKNTNDILRKANEQIQILEKQRELFDKGANRLNYSELKNYPNLSQAITVIQKGQLIEKMSQDLKKSLLELGNEGTILKIRLKELLSNVEKETNLVIKDYTQVDVKKSKSVLNGMNYDEIINPENILKALSCEEVELPLKIKGWRILSKTPLNEKEIAMMIKEFEILNKIIHLDLKSCEEILGKEKAESFKEDIEKIKFNY